MTELVICRGLPGSGKTTYTRLRLSSAAGIGRRGSIVRSNRDDYRWMLFDTGYVGAPERPLEDIVSIAQHTAIRGLLRAGISVICDDTNLHEWVVVELISIAEESGVTWRVKDFTHIPLATCIARDRTRALGSDTRSYVGEEIIQRMFDRHSVNGWAPMPIPELNLGVR